MIKPWLQSLNPPQQQAVTAPLTNLLVLAGAGSGKTRVLVNRMAWLISEQRMSPDAILCVTFTNKAAQEMKMRLSQLLSLPIANLWVGTFHGICHRILRRHYELANLPQSFQILDTDDQTRLLKRVITNLNLSIEKWPVKQAQGFIHFHKEEGRRPAHLWESSFGPARTWLKIYETYESACLAAGLIDFAEMILRTIELFKRHPDILHHYQQRFGAILVDEFQDTNANQYEWISLLRGAHTSVMAVGDDDQSIYGWRGAKVENIERFTKDFNPVTVIRLEQNYRSSGTILKAANALIANNSDRMGKALWTSGDEGSRIVLYGAFNELEEAKFITERILKANEQGIPYRDMAILYRSNAQSRVIEEALLRAEIAYRIYGGMRFFDRAEIKDTLAYLRIITNPHDDASFERIINFPTRGIGDKTVSTLRELSHAHTCSLWQAIDYAILHDTLSARAKSSLTAFTQLIQTLQSAVVDMQLHSQVNHVIHQCGIHDHFANIKGEQSEIKLDNLQELVNAAKQFQYDYEEEDDSLPVLTAFLTHASLESGELQSIDADDYVHMMTMHAAKGLEFPVVFLIGVEEGIFPSRLSLDDPARLEEERRLCYVGMTRAMSHLILSYAEIRRHYGREEYHRPSRFISEIPKALLDEIRPRRQFTQASPTPTAIKEEASGFYLGQLVQHATFGEGIIIGMEGSGAHARVHVQFKTQGKKWLVIAYANLVV